MKPSSSPCSRGLCRPRSGAGRSLPCKARAHPGHGAAGLGLAKRPGAAAAGWKRILANPHPSPQPPALPVPRPQGKAVCGQLGRQSPGRWRAWGEPRHFTCPVSWGWVLPRMFCLSQGRPEVGIAVAALGGKVLPWAFTTSNQFHRHSHLSEDTPVNPDPPGPSLCPRGAPRVRIPRMPRSHTCTERCPCSAATPQALHSPNLCGELVYKKRSAGFPNKPPSPQHISSHT